VSPEWGEGLLRSGRVAQNSIQACNKRLLRDYHSRARARARGEYRCSDTVWSG